MESFDLDEIKRSDWYKERPKVIQEMICKIPPSAVILKKTKQIGEVHSYNEDGTISVVIHPEDNPFVKCPCDEPYEVFGIPVDDLIPLMK